MEKKFNFVYITTNLINGHQYIGEHSSNDLNCYKTINYIGSGRPYFDRAKKKYGRRNFKREIFEFFPTKKEAFDAQEKYIIQFNTLTPNGYNISPKGGHGVKGCMSKETKERIKAKRIENDSYHLSEESRNLIRVSLTGRKDSEEVIQNKKNADRSKWDLSEEGRKNISQSMSKRLKGKPITIEHKNNIQKNSSKYWEGKTLSEDHRNKLRISHMGKKSKRVICEHCHKEIAVNIYAIFHGDKCKLK